MEPHAGKKVVNPQRQSFEVLWQDPGHRSSFALLLNYFQDCRYSSREALLHDRAILRPSESKLSARYRNDLLWPARWWYDAVHPEVFNNLSIMVTSMHQRLHNECRASHFASFQGRYWRGIHRRVHLADGFDGFGQMRERAIQIIEYFGLGSYSFRPDFVACICRWFFSQGCCG